MISLLLFVFVPMWDGFEVSSVSTSGHYELLQGHAMTDADQHTHVLKNRYTNFRLVVPVLGSDLAEPDRIIEFQDGRVLVAVGTNFNTHRVAMFYPSENRFETLDDYLDNDFHYVDLDSSIRDEETIVMNVYGVSGDRGEVIWSPTGIEVRNLTLSEK